MVSVYHNLGLGDHILFCGLVHSIIKSRNSPIKIYCKEHNVPSVSALYNGYNIIVEPVRDDAEVQEKVDSLCVNLHRTSRRNGAYSTFDEEVYSEAGIPHLNRWSYFKLNPSINILPVNMEGYAFVHDDPERGFFIESNRNGRKIITCDNICRPTKSSIFVIFDYLSLILNADEVHVIDSCFRILADQLYCSEKFISLRTNKKEPKLFYHRYSRTVEGDGWHVPAVMHPSWEVID